MKYRIVEISNKSYIIYDNKESKITLEEDVLDVMSSCFENGIYNLIIDGSILSENFYKLKTKQLGMALQKFINYNIKVSIIVEEKKELSQRFKELALELNKGKDFRVLNRIEEGKMAIKVGF